MKTFLIALLVLVGFSAASADEAKQIWAPKLYVITADGTPAILTHNILRFDNEAECKEVIEDPRHKMLTAMFVQRMFPDRQSFEVKCVQLIDERGA